MYLPKYFQYTEVLLREKQRNKTINQLKEKLGEKILRLGGKFVFLNFKSYFLIKI